MMGKILVTGCGLGATHFTAKLLQECGLDVAHERVRSDGVVSFGHATWCDPVARQRDLCCGKVQWCFGGGPPSDDVFDVVLRQVRNPRKVATSIGRTATSDTWAKLLKAAETRFDISVPWPPGQTEREQMKAGVTYTYWWYIYAGLHARWTFRVEDVEAVLPDILHAAGHEVSPQEQQQALDAVSTDAGSRKAERGYQYWTWHEIKRVPWGQELHAMARSFGYDVGDGI